MIAGDEPELRYGIDRMVARGRRIFGWGWVSHPLRADCVCHALGRRRRAGNRGYPSTSASSATMSRKLSRHFPTPVPRALSRPGMFLRPRCSNGSWKWNSVTGAARPSTSPRRPMWEPAGAGCANWAISCARSGTPPCARRFCRYRASGAGAELSRPDAGPIRRSARAAGPPRRCVTRDTDVRPQHGRRRKCLSPGDHRRAPGRGRRCPALHLQPSYPRLPAAGACAPVQAPKCFASRHFCRWRRSWPAPQSTRCS